MKNITVPAYTPQRRSTYVMEQSPFTSGSIESTYTTGHKRKTDNTSLIFQLQKIMRINKTYLFNFFKEKLRKMNKNSIEKIPI